MNRCYFCGHTYNLERHHVFYGTANRRKSEQYGMVTYLCHNCHNEPPYGVHHNKKNDLKLKQDFQKKFEEQYPELDFIKEFGKNYVE